MEITKTLETVHLLYIILESNDMDDLADQVNDVLGSGGILVGGVSFTPVWEEETKEWGERYVQAVMAPTVCDD